MISFRQQIAINSCERNIENWILRVNNISPLHPVGSGILCPAVDPGVELRMLLMCVSGKEGR